LEQLVYVFVDTYINRADVATITVAYVVACIVSAPDDAFSTFVVTVIDANHPGAVEGHHVCSKRFNLRIMMLIRI